MALYSQLPIYKVAYDLLSVATDYVQHMPRPFKAAIGGRLRAYFADGGATLKRKPEAARETLREL